jgi:hypothetical protein
MAGSRTIALATTGALAIAGAAVVWGGTGDRQDPRAAGPGHATAAASSTPTAAGTASAGDPTGSTGGSTAKPKQRPPAPGSDPPTTGPTGSGSGSGGGPGSEILPTPAGDPTATGYQLPPIPTTTPAPLLGATLPEPAVAKRRLVKGFPAALAPPRGTRIESSSVSVADRALQAALVATGGDPRTILLHYRDLLSVRGFTERETQGVENAPAAAFAKGPENVTVTTVDGRTYVLANLRPKGATH